MQTELKFDNTNTHEKTLVTKIEQLEKETESFRAELKKGITKELFQKINARTAEISDLKIKLRFESQLKEKYWKLFEDKTTFEDFSRLWNDKLRDEAVIEDAKEKENAVRLASRHSIYSKW